MDLHMDKISVQHGLETMRDLYPRFNEKLESANTIIRNMSTYWSGHNFELIYTDWNNSVKVNNEILNDLSVAINKNSNAFFIYTTADKAPVEPVQQTPAVLDEVIPDNNTNVSNMNTERLQTDLTQLSGDLQFALTLGDELIQTALNIEWNSSDALPRLKLNLFKNKDLMDENLKRIIDNVTANLEEVIKTNINAEESVEG